MTASSTRSIAAIQADMDDTTGKRTAWKEELSDCKVEIEAITRDLRESGVDDLMAQQTKANALERLIATADAKLSALRAELAATEAAEIRAVALGRLASIAAEMGETLAEMRRIRARLSARVSKDVRSLIALHDRQVSLRNRFIANADGFDLLDFTRELEAQGHDTAVVRATWFGSQVVGDRFDRRGGIDVPTIGHGVDEAINGYLLARQHEQMRGRDVERLRERAQRERERLERSEQLEREQWQARRANDDDSA